jgi:spore germination protein YaaH
LLDEPQDLFENVHASGEVDIEFLIVSGASRARGTVSKGAVVGRTKLFAAALAAVLLALVAPRSAAATPRIVLGWNYGGTASAYVAADAAAPGLNTVSPAWWMLRPDGTVADTASSAFVAWAHAHGERVWPMFTNDLDQTASRNAMRDATLRARVIASVRDLAKRYGVDGVNIDWENLATADRDAFGGFVRQAATVWRASGLTTTVDVGARTDHWQLGNWSESFDRRALGAAADYVVLMAYDEHNRLRPDGPTASISWVEESVRYLLRTTPASKIILGVPFYTNDWDDATKKFDVVTYARSLAHVRAHHAVVRWDARAGSELATYTIAGHTHHMWFEDARSLAMKASLVSRYGLQGVAAWRIGFETPDAWRALEAAPAPAPPPTGSRTIAPTPSPTVAPPTGSPSRGALASPPPLRPASRRSTISLTAAFLAFAIAAIAVFFFRRTQRV